MEEKNLHPLQLIWEKHSDIFNKKSKKIKIPEIGKYIGDLFAMGEYYYYILNLTDGTLSNVNTNSHQIHGFETLPTHLHQILELIHPDDVNFVTEAEKICIEKIKLIGINKIKDYKASYCFRMKTANGNYDLFHHQSIHIKTDYNHRLIQAINIHTNINHITSINPYTILLSGIGNEKKSYQIKYSKKENIIPNMLSITKREKEVLNLLANGLSAEQISLFLNLSYHTITTHRKNILTKTESKNIPQAIKKALETGIL